MLPVRLVRFCPAVCQHLHSKSAGDIGHLLPDLSKTDDADRLVIQLLQWRYREAPVGRKGPAAVFYRVRMLLHMLTELQQQGETELRYRIRAIVRHIADRNAPFFCSPDINDIIARCQHSNKP